MPLVCRKKAANGSSNDLFNLAYSCCPVFPMGANTLFPTSSSMTASIHRKMHYFFGCCQPSAVARLPFWSLGEATITELTGCMSKRPPPDRECLIQPLRGWFANSSWGVHDVKQRRCMSLNQADRVSPTSIPLIQVVHIGHIEHK